MNKRVLQKGINKEQRNTDLYLSLFEFIKENTINL